MLGDHTQTGGWRQKLTPPSPAAPQYVWGYHSSDSAFVHVALDYNGHRDTLFDVALYDRTVLDQSTGRNCEDQSLFDLRQLIGLANAALKAGLEPEPVAEKEE